MYFHKNSQVTTFIFTLHQTLDFTFRLGKKKPFSNNETHNVELELRA